MKTTLILRAIISVYLVFLYSCSNNDDDNTQISNEPDIYVVGYGDSSNGSEFAAKYWENNTLKSLTNGTGWAEAKSVYANDNDVYIGGFEENLSSNKFTPKYWKNGVGFELTTNSKSSAINSIVVSNGDVFSAGYGFTESSPSIQMAQYWKNNTLLELSDAINGIATDICVSNNIPYICGKVGNRARYWVNGNIPFTLPLSNGYRSSVANSIYVVGNDVYVCGTMFHTSTGAEATIWKNGIASKLSSNSRSHATSITIFNGDIYVTGYEDNSGRQIAKYWKNGNSINLTDNNAITSAIANDIYIKDDIICVSGWVIAVGEKAKAVYWKNGERIDLSDGTFTTRANGIFVK